MAKELTKKEVEIKPIKWQGVYEKTPEEYILKRQGRGGKVLSYVATGYIIKRLNELFNYLWDFEIVEESIYKEAKQISVRGKLTVHISPTLSVSKTQYGSAVIKMLSTGMPISIGDDKKAASSDALKKCASLFGIASDLYWGGEVEDDKELPDTDADAVIS